MIRKSAQRFSEKIMLKQQPKAYRAIATPPAKCKSLPEDRQGSAERMMDGECEPFGGPSWTCTGIEVRISRLRKINL